MQIILQPVQLDTQDGDADGFLLLRGGRLFAIVSRLSHHHGDAAGSLFIEAALGGHDAEIGRLFENEDALVRWASDMRERAIPPMPHSAALVDAR